MACKNCSKKPYSDKMCKRCFVLHFEKKVRKSLRGKIRKNSKVFIIDKKDSASYALKKNFDVLKLPLKFVDKKNEADFVMIPSSLEKEVLDFLEHFLMGDIQDVKKAKKKEVRMFQNQTQQEINLYSQTKGYKIVSKDKIKTSIVEEMVEELEEKYPGIKKAIYKGVEGFRTAIKKR